MEGRRHPLTGLRVLEMGSRVAAPYVGKLFADAGADVCTVESPAGDQCRRWSASRSRTDLRIPMCAEPRLCWRYLYR